MITFSQLGTLPWGRLGNQLFCIAATIGVAHRNGQPFVLPPWSYADAFAHPLPTGTVDRPSIYHQPGFAYTPVDLPSGNWDLRGAFQSERFFAEAADLVRHYFTPAPALVQAQQQAYGHLLTDNTCSLHVRRGDYLRHQPAFPPQPLAYYETAIDQFPADTRFLVFSDDLPWCRQHFIGDRFSFIEGQTDIADLFLMSRCHHHIMANSSFSWWGAWLNPSPDKRVYCPALWFGPAVSPRPLHYARDLYAAGFTPLLPAGTDPARVARSYRLLYPAYALYMATLKAGVNTLRWLRLRP
ncbi:alpha-1,2-fucosyltransferase [Spirosoma luteolum]